MQFLNPLAFALAALAAPIVALYFLKLRREQRTVSSTYLWRTLVRDTAANAPWQRLRPNLLLFLQLLFLLVVVCALGRPFRWTEAVAGDHLILVLDTSASMAAADQAPSRLAAAVEQARRLVAGLPADARVTLIAAGDRTDVLVSGTTDRDPVYRALDTVRAGAGGSDLSAALNLAAAVAAREQDPETVIISDGNVTVPNRPLPGSASGRSLSIPGRVRFVPVGSATAGNQGIMALSLRKTAGGQSLSAFAQVTNFGTSAVERRLVLTASGQPIAARTLALAPNQPQALTFDDLPLSAGLIEARLEGSDALALDDRAWATSGPAAALKVDMVGPGNRFIETALSLLPGLAVTIVKPGDYGRGQSSEAAAQSAHADLTIFDGAVPTATLPSGALLFVAPVSSTALFSMTGQIAAPSAAAAAGDEPLLRYVDLSGLQIQEADRIPLPSWARAVILAGGPAADCPPTGSQGNGDLGAGSACPLLFAGETGGRRAAVLAFDVRKSDLPLRVAFPLLLANLLDYLNADTGAGSLPAQVVPGQPVTLAVPPAALQVAVTLPDGTIRRMDASGSRAVFGETGQLGPYAVRWTGEGNAAGDVGTFAVNLFNPAESAIAAKNSIPVRGSADAGDAAAPRQDRQEWWRPLAWLALVLLAVEWLYAHRGQVVQLWTGALRRFGRATSPRGGANV